MYRIPWSRKYWITSKHRFVIAVPCARNPARPQLPNNVQVAVRSCSVCAVRCTVDIVGAQLVYHIQGVVLGRLVCVSSITLLVRNLARFACFFDARESQAQQIHKPSPRQVTCSPLIYRLAGAQVASRPVCTVVVHFSAGIARMNEAVVSLLAL